MSTRQGLRSRNQSAAPRAQSAAPDTPNHPHAQRSPPSFGRGTGRGLLDSPLPVPRNIVPMAPPAPQAPDLRDTLGLSRALNKISATEYKLKDPGMETATEAWAKISNLTAVLVSLGIVVKQRNGEFFVAHGQSDTMAQEILDRFCLQDFHTREHVRMHVPPTPTRNWTNLVNMVIGPYKITQDVLQVLTAFHTFFAPAQLKSLRGLSHYIQCFASKLHEFEISMRNIAAFPGTQVVDAFLQTLASDVVLYFEEALRAHGTPLVDLRNFQEIGFDSTSGVGIRNLRKALAFLTRTALSVEHRFLWPRRCLHADAQVFNVLPMSVAPAASVNALLDPDQDEYEAAAVAALGRGRGQRQVVRQPSMAALTQADAVQQGLCLFCFQTAHHWRQCPKLFEYFYGLIMRSQMQPPSHWFQPAPVPFGAPWMRAQVPYGGPMGNFAHSPAMMEAPMAPPPPPPPPAPSAPPPPAPRARAPLRFGDGLRSPARVAALDGHDSSPGVDPHPLSPCEEMQAVLDDEENLN